MTNSNGSIGFSPGYATNVLDEDARVLRGPFQVALDITNRCNFRCMHCYNASGENYIKPSDELTDEEILDFATDLASLKPYNFCFCGGETLLRKDLMIEAAKILKTGCRYVSMVTNGYLVTPELAREIIENGITRIQVSLDGAGPNTHDRLRRQQGAFLKAVAAIQAFRDAGAHSIEAAFCPTRFNSQELPAVYELCRQLGVGSLRVQPLMYLGRANKFIDELVPTNSQYRELVSIINKYKAACALPSIEWGDPIDHIIRFRTIISACVPHVNIKANGSITPTPYMPLTVGNIKRHRFSEYWNSGLIGVWQNPTVQEFAEHIQSVPDYCKASEDAPRVWFEEDVDIDLIDSDVFKKELV